MSQLNSLLESAGSGWKNMQSDAARLANKWERTGLLEGFSKEVDKNNMSLILENQAKQLVTEQSQTGGTANFTVGTGEQWAGVALPLVRKVFGQIAAKEFVSVQPMSLPAGLVFYLDFQYGSSKKPFTSGDSMFGTPSEGFGNKAEGGLYGAGRFGYSINQFSSSVNSKLVVSGTWAQVNFDGNLSASAARNEIKTVTFTSASISDSLDGNAIRSFVVSSGSILEARQLPAFTTQAANGNITFAFSGSGLELTDGNNYVVSYSKKTADNARGDFEDGAAYSNQAGTAGQSISIPEIDIQMRSETIAAKTRKLKAQWTPEFSQDLNAFHSIDAEAELTSILSEYISLEIDLEILDMLIENAPTTEVWSAKVGNQLNAAGTGFDSNTNGVYYTQMSWFQTLGIKLQKVSNIIHQRTLRGGANFIVVSPTVATILESIPGFAADSNGDVTAASYAFGVQKVGALNSRYKVYKNPYMTENTILMGFRGNQFLESGAVYAPYIPLIMTPLVYDPNTFTPRKGIMTRYAKKMVRPEFYGKVFVSDLDVV